MNTSFTLSLDLKLTVEEGKYGKFVRLTRGTRWMVFSPNMWEKIKISVYHLLDTDFYLRLSSEKDVKAVVFKDRRYVSFHSIYKWQDNVYNTYINLNEDEWQNFINACTKINLKKRAANTPTCHDMKKVVLVDGCMKKTTLNPTALQFVKDNNNSANNQLELMCEYCGLHHGMGDFCHCHKYNCKDCEPDNFCKTCDELTVTA